MEDHPDLQTIHDFIVSLCDCPHADGRVRPQSQVNDTKTGPPSRAVKKCLDVHEMPTIGLARSPTLGMAGGAAASYLGRASDKCSGRME